MQSEQQAKRGMALGFAGFAAAISTGLCLGLGAFVLGFLFGVVRIVFITPVIGPVPAVLIEVALFLPILWWGVRAICEMAGVGRFDARCMVGATAFAVLLGLESAFALIVIGLSAQDYVAATLSPAGLIGLVGQAGLLVFPAFSGRTIPAQTGRGHT